MEDHGIEMCGDLIYGFNFLQTEAMHAYKLILVVHLDMAKKFLNSGNKEWEAKMHDDLIDLVNWAIPPYWEPLKKLFNESVGNLETE